jgi:hypothetical protein
MDPVKLVHVEWFDYDNPVHPGGVLLRGLGFDFGDQFASPQQIIDVPGTLNPIHDGIDQDGYDFFLMEFQQM